MGLVRVAWTLRPRDAAGDLDRAKALLANPPTSWEIHASVVWEAAERAGGARTRQLLAAALGSPAAR